ASVPSVQPPADAAPVLSVWALAFWTVPPPEFTVKLTVTPGTPRSFASRTITLGALGTGVPASAVWPSPFFTIRSGWPLLGPRSQPTSAVATIAIVMKALKRRNVRPPAGKKRRGPESNRRIAVLQTAALPLGYRAELPALRSASDEGSGKLLSRKHLLKLTPRSTHPGPASCKVRSPMESSERRHP